MELAEEPYAYSSGDVVRELHLFFRLLREQRQLTQTQLAEASGLDQGSVSRLERVSTADPAISVVLRAINGLGLRPSEFWAQFEQRLAAGGFTPVPRMATHQKPARPVVRPTDPIFTRLGYSLVTAMTHVAAGVTPVPSMADQTFKALTSDVQEREAAITKALTQPKKATKPVKHRPKVRRHK